MHFFNIIKMCFVQIFNKQVVSTVLFIQIDFSQVYSVIIIKIHVEWTLFNEREGTIYLVTLKAKIIYFLVIWMLKIRFTLFLYVRCIMNKENRASKITVGINQVYINYYKYCQPKILLNLLIQEHLFRRQKHLEIRLLYINS